MSLLTTVLLASSLTLNGYCLCWFLARYPKRLTITTLFGRVAVLPLSIEPTKRARVFTATCGRRRWLHE